MRVCLGRHLWLIINSRPTGADSRGGRWELNNLTRAAEAPLAEGEPAGLVLRQSSGRVYVYRGCDGHIHELNFDGAWMHRNLSEAASD